MRQVSPADPQPLFEQEGVDLVLTAVEVTQSDELCLAVVGVEGPHTAAMDTSFHEELAAWGARRRATATTDAVPTQPAERVLALSFRVSDDVGTAYHFDRSAIGGTDRMFRGEWWFKPAVPVDARELSIAVIGDEGRERSLAFAVTP
jgi:hypothetical protein